MYIVAKAPESVASSILATATPGVDRACVYFDRVYAKVARDGSIGTALGDVIAHELAHLMLPPRHAEIGIMRPVMDTHAPYIQTFTKLDALAIRRRIQLGSDTP